MTVISPEESAKQAKDFIEYRHRQERKPNTERVTGADKYAKRVEIDSKLSDMSDEKWIAEMTNYGA
jgi:hypothetical protein